MKLSEKKELEKQTRDSEYGKKIAALAEVISETMEDLDQGYIFSVIPNEGDKRTHFGSFKLSSNNYPAFWASLLCSIQDVQMHIPEDKLEGFSEGFLPMVFLAMKYCFPTMRINGDFYDEMEGELNGNQD